MKWRIAALGLLLTALSGCADNMAPPGPPPVEFSFRKSQIPLKGMVLGIQNTSNAEITITSVGIRNPGEQGIRSHVVEKTVKPQDTVTVGWVELDGWILKPGDEVTVECKGFDVPTRVTIPEL